MNLSRLVNKFLKAQQKLARLQRIVRVSKSAAVVLHILIAMLRTRLVRFTTPFF